MRRVKTPKGDGYKELAKEIVTEAKGEAGPQDISIIQTIIRALGTRDGGEIISSDAF